MSYKVFINPGHCPGKDPGACNDELGLQEADICLEIGRKLRDLLVDEGFEVFFEQSHNLCGNDGQDWGTSVCVNANRAQANIFVSIHCNSFGSAGPQGTEVFYHPESIKGKELAEYMQYEIVHKLDMVERFPNMERGRELAVCKHTNMPAVLVELGFISNSEDADKLVNRQEDFAQAMCSAIKKYFA